MTEQEIRAYYAHQAVEWTGLTLSIGLFIWAMWLMIGSLLGWR